MQRLALAGSYRRVVAVLTVALGIAASGALVGAGAAWSDGTATMAASHHGHNRPHGGGGASGGGSSASSSTTTTTTTTVTTTTTTTAHASTSTKTSSTRTNATVASSTKSGTPPKPKPKPKPVVRLTATLAITPAFPQRELGLWTSSGMPFGASQVHVTENGQPVTGLRLTPVSQAGPGQFGVVIVLDETSSMSAQDRGLELAAAVSLAKQRIGHQALGVVTFAGTPTVMLPLTSNPTLVNEALANQPLVAPGESVLSALSLAYSQLHEARIASGAVILVTAGKQLASPAAEAALSQAGAKLGYQTFTTDILAGVNSAQASGSGSGDGDAAQERALGQNLSSAADIWSQLSTGYLASYRSDALPGKAVVVSVSVDGIAGSSSFDYTAAHPPALTAAGPSEPPSHPAALSPYPAFARFVHAAAPAGPSVAPSSFWSSSVSIVTVAFLCALLLGASLWLLIGGVGHSEVERRVSNFIPDAQAVDDSGSLIAVSTPGVPPILARRRWWAGFALLVDVGRFRRSAVTLVKLAAAGSLVAAVLFTLLLGSVVGALLGLAIGPLVLYAVVRRAARRHRARFSDQLPSSLQDMAGAVRGGRSMAGSLEAVMDGADEPLFTEFERAVTDEKLGRPLEATLHTMAERMKSEDMEQVALVAALHRRSGSSVAEALDHVAEGARERAELIRELKSLTGQAKLSSRILTGLPLALFVVLSLMEPSYMRPLLHTAGGVAITLLCAGMVTLGWLVMRRIVKVEA